MAQARLEGGQLDVVLDRAQPLDQSARDDGHPAAHRESLHVADRERRLDGDRTSRQGLDRDGERVAIEHGRQSGRLLGDLVAIAPVRADHVVRGPSSDDENSVASREAAQIANVLQARDDDPVGLDIDAEARAEPIAASAVMICRHPQPAVSVATARSARR